VCPENSSGAPRTPSGSDILRVVRALVSAVRESSAYPDVLFRICEALTRTVPCDRATIYLASSRRRAFLPAADHGTPAEVVQTFIRRGYSRGAFPGEEELRAGRSVLAVEGETSPAFEEVLTLARLHALVVVPLTFQGGAGGSLACGMHQPPALRSEQVMLLEAVAPHIAVLIQNARLEAQASRLAARRGKLAAWAAEILEAADFDALMARLCAASRDLFGGTRAGLLLLENGELVARHAEGPRPPGPVRIPLDVSSPPTDALRTNRVLVLNQFRRTEYAATPLGRFTYPAAALVAPLIDATGPLGVLSVADADDPYRFGPTDEEDMRLLAAIATVALRKDRLVEALRRASAAKSEFLANVSHDLRTPLNVIVGYTQLMAEETFGPVTPEQADTLGRVLRTSEDQLHLIDDLLDLARIEQGKLSCTLAPVRVAALVPSLQETMEVLLRDRPVRFEVAVAPDAVASTDAERLRQVLVNLLANAAKFTQAGCVSLAASREGDCVRVSVIDTGPGMDPSLGDRALEPFVRGPEGPMGSGLGLAIVARLLPLLGGRLSIESAPGQGTGVHVRLPAACE